MPERNVPLQTKREKWQSYYKSRKPSESDHRSTPESVATDGKENANEAHAREMEALRRENEALRTESRALHRESRAITAVVRSHIRHAGFVIELARNNRWRRALVAQARSEEQDRRLSSLSFMSVELSKAGEKEAEEDFINQMEEIMQELHEVVEKGDFVRSLNGELGLADQEHEGEDEGAAERERDV
jgi:hypothetical protein